MTEQTSKKTDPFRIAVWCFKGGVGKTMMSINIAHGLRRRGYKVLIVDNDPQRSLYKLVSKFLENEEERIQVIFGEPAGRTLDVDFIVTDHPPNLDKNYMPKNPDVILSPVIPEAPDLLAWDDGMKNLPKKHLRRVIPIISMLDMRVKTQMVTALRVKRDCPSALIVNKYSIFARQISLGESVYSGGNKYGTRKGIAQMDHVVDAVLNRVKMPLKAEEVGNDKIATEG